MQAGYHTNRAALCGRAAGEPIFSHINHGMRYDVFPLSVPRLSGTEDRLNVLASHALLESCPFRPGDPLWVQGEVRTFNNRSGVGSRLVITLFARELRPGSSEPFNHLELTGAVCKPPILRRTPLGRDICDLMLAVNRRYGRADYLPCIAWGALARCCGELGVGDGIRLDGRLQSREYTKVDQGVTEKRTAYEISVMHLEPMAAEPAQSPCAGAANPVS